MKNRIIILTAVIALIAYGCKENPYINAPGDNSYTPDTIEVLVADTNGIVVSVDSAYNIGANLTIGAITADKYKVTGVISVTTNRDEVPLKYNNVNLVISDGGKKSLTCQYTNYLNNYPFSSSSQIPADGSKVTIVGQIQKYNSTPQIYQGFILRVDSAAVAE